MRINTGAPVPPGFISPFFSPVCEKMKIYLLLILVLFLVYRIHIVSANPIN